MDTLTAWQSLPSRMDPVLFQIGSFQLQWYGLMYLVAFAVTYFLAKSRLRSEPARFPYTPDFLQNLMTWAFFGVLLGGLVCGWLRSMRPRWFGRIPGPTLWIFESIGLTGFVAVVGLNAGPDFVAGLRASGSFKRRTFCLAANIRKASAS